MEARPVRRYEQRLRELAITIPTPFDARAFCAHVAEQRGRPITVIMMDTSEVSAPCGLWLSTNKADYVVVDSTAPPVLRDHILLHETAHIICNHKGLLQVDAKLMGLDIIDPAVVERVLGRNSGYAKRYGTAEEREAEGLASVITEFAARRSPVPRPTKPGNDTAAVLDRFSSALAGDRRWL
ncbi:hypothetical protein JIG36_51130 [Actinoplanes sp. LDG1-06]|uniref:IrrE N-terminal-like domain-containing protein n=1 Tax=Paractinoplanes ovalisporus TaxID=2810368 RepID=A0ABS2AWU2_9ACTN|nr:hypothetical protein [Actinoplanes ovalisporus]MBM2623873.1 hypothetical protein [Actinoplanes ovalisporus]